MRVFYSLDELRGQIKNPAVAVGSFDGVHAGHRAILDELKKEAAALGGEAVVVTFSPHPRQVVNRSEFAVELLSSLEEKTFLLDSYGIDNLFVIPFTPEFSQLSYVDFAREYLLEGIGAKAIVMGYNHQFGRDREGNRDYLEELRTQYDFEVIQLLKQEVADQKISSSIIRGLIHRGDMKLTNQCLAEPYFFIARSGNCGLLDYDEPAKLFPPNGIYPVTVKDGETEKSTKLMIADGKLGIPPLSKTCAPGQRLLIEFGPSNRKFQP